MEEMKQLFHLIIWLARLSPAGWYKVKYTLCNKDKLVNSIKPERAFYPSMDCSFYVRKIM